MKNIFGLSKWGLVVCALLLCIGMLVAFAASPQWGTAGLLLGVPFVGMAMGATSGMSKSVKCTAAIGTAYTIATPGADDDTFSVASAATAALIGIFQSTTNNAGDFAEVMVDGISRLALGGIVSRGNEITSDANGKGVVAGFGQNTIGIALASGVAGDIIPVFIQQDICFAVPAGYVKQTMMKIRAEVALADAAATITAAQMIDSSMFKITPTVARALTTDTAANLVAGMPGCQVGTYFDFSIVCLAAFAVTLGGGAGVTLVGSGAVSNASGTFRAVFTSVGAGTEAVTIHRIA